MTSDPRSQETTDFATAAERAGRGTLLGELWYYLKLYRSWLVVPILLMLVLLGAFVTASGSGVAPFIYALF